MKVESVSWNKNIQQKWTKEKNVKMCESKEKNTNWNSCIGSVKEKDELKRKEIQQDFGPIFGLKMFTWLKPNS